MVLVDLKQNKESLALLVNSLKAEAISQSIKISSFCMSSLSDLDAIEELIEQIKEEFETECVQFLFNNLDSLMLANDQKAQIPSILSPDVDNAALQAAMDLNFWGPLHWTRTLLPLLAAKENLDANKPCFIINSSAFRVASHSGSFYSVSKQCAHALSEVMKREIDKIDSFAHLKLKILSVGFVESNEAYNVANITQRLDDSESVANAKKIVKKVELSLQEFGGIVFDEIRDKNAFLIASHPQMT